MADIIQFEPRAKIAELKRQGYLPAEQAQWIKIINGKPQFIAQEVVDDASLIALREILKGQP